MFDHIADLEVIELPSHFRVFCKLCDTVLLEAFLTKNYKINYT